MNYTFYNANPNSHYVNDCTIRAISLAEGKSWDETYDELSKIAQKNRIILDDVNFIEPFLDERYERECFEDVYVGEFAENHPYGTYLITMDGHITCCINGVIYDTFNCLNRMMKCAWFVHI